MMLGRHARASFAALALAGWDLQAEELPDARPVLD